MNKNIEKVDKLPDFSEVYDNFGKVDYFDSYSTILNNNFALKEFANTLFAMPKWVDMLMKMRNFIVSKFGLITDVEDLYTFFPVLSENENELVMAADDKHLNFRVSIIKEAESLTDNKYKYYITTIVHYNNFAGNFYFFFVKPFHRVIVPYTLNKNLLKKYN